MEPVVGIVAEYNPFHFGHARQIEQLKRQTVVNATVAVMSGYFTQRGLPAVAAPHKRAEAAVRCGIDLVIELPLPFCSFNAGVFAAGAVKLLQATGVVTALSFGMETPGEPLRETASILVHESAAFKAALRQNLDSGASYAVSRAQAAQAELGRPSPLFSSPNNLLALSYVEAALRQGWNPDLFPLQREGAGYSDSRPCGRLSSAAAVRALLAENRTDEALVCVPAPSAEILKCCLRGGRAVTDTKRYWTALKVLLHRETSESLQSYAEFGEGIENALLDAYEDAPTVEELVERLSTRRYPRTRLFRQLLYVFLGLKQPENKAFQSAGPQWIRPLAASPNGRRRLAQMRDAAHLPVVSRLGDVPHSDIAQSMALLGLRGAKLWEELTDAPRSRDVLKEHFILADPCP